MNHRNDLNCFFDNRAEREQFERLLSFQDEARLLSICDKGGWGKSHLLRVLAQRCRTNQPRIPVCLIALHQLEDKSEFGLVLEAYNQLLRYFRRPFPEFTKLRQAMELGDYERIQSSQHFEEVNFEGARRVNIANSQVNAEIVENIYLLGDREERPKLTEPQLLGARSACVEAFFADLKEICQSRPVVLLFDAYDSSEPALRQWIVTTLLERYIFDFENRPNRLLIVLAGQKVPDYEGEWPPDLVRACVRLLPKMSQWKEEDIEECLTTYGYPYEQHHKRVLLDMAEKGVPPKTILHVISLMFGSEAV